MNPMKLKILEELLSHMDSSSGMDLKSLLDESKKPAEASPLEESGESPQAEMDEEGKPKGIAIEKVSVLGKKPGEMDDPMGKPGGVGVEDEDDKPSPDELKYLLSKMGLM